MAWAKTRPEAFSEKTGKPDTRGAYGLLAREVIGLLKHLQHAPGKTVIFVGILERVTDEFNRVTWQPQMEGGKAGTRASRHRRSGHHHEPVRRRRATAGGMSPSAARSAASSAAPAIHSAFPPRTAADASTSPSRPTSARCSRKINSTSERMTTMSFDMNDAEPQKSGELIPDGTFAKVTMTIRPGGIDGQSEIDQALLKAPKDPTSDVRMLDCEFTVVEGPHARRKFWQMFTVQGGKVDENGVSIGWKISKSTFRAMIDSALGLDPQDMSEAAKQKRILRGLADLNDITFIAKIKIEPSEDARYGDQNRLDRVVLPTDKEWKLVMDGKDVPASPSRSRGAGSKAAATQPAWAQATAQGGQPAAATAIPAAVRRAGLVATVSRRGPHRQQSLPGPAWLNG